MDSVTAQIRSKVALPTKNPQQDLAPKVAAYEFDKFNQWISGEKKIYLVYASGRQ